MKTLRPFICGLCFSLPSASSFALAAEAPAPASASKTTSASSAAQTPASPPSPDEIAVAKKAFARGLSLQTAGKFNEAAVAFREALAIKETPGLYYYLGRSLEDAGLLLEAHEAYLKAGEFTGERAQADVTAVLPEARAGVEARLAGLFVEDPGEGAQIFFDGVGIQPEAMVYSIPGSHELRATRPGFAPFQRVIRGMAGMREIVHVEFVPLAVEKPHSNAAGAGRSSAETGDAPDASLRDALVWTGLGLGAAGLGVGVAGIVLGQSARADADAATKEIDAASGGSLSACASPSNSIAASCLTLESALREEDSAQVMMIAGLASAGVGLVGAASAYFFWPESKIGLSGEWGRGGPKLTLRGEF